MNVIHISVIFVGLLWLGASTLPAATRYVVEPGTPGGTSAPPYTNWGISATQIQWAVDSAGAGETVWVSNGVYVLTNQIVIANGITLRSVTP